MSIVFKGLQSLANRPVPLGAQFAVRCRIARDPGDTGTLALSCLDAGYWVAPAHIPVGPGGGEEDGDEDMIMVEIHGPPGPATVRVRVTLGQWSHEFTQDVI